nr:hypothetical protein [Bacteroidota bacterium]
MIKFTPIDFGLTILLTLSMLFEALQFDELIGIQHSTYMFSEIGFTGIFLILLALGAGYFAKIKYDEFIVKKEDKKYQKSKAR